MKESACPSRLLVTSNIGMRMIEGNKPKYVYVRPCVHESFDAKCSTGQRQVAVKHGARLQVEEVALEY